jgi:hypothetical protein
MFVKLRSEAEVAESRTSRVGMMAVTADMSVSLGSG